MRATLSAESAKYAQKSRPVDLLRQAIGDFGTAYTYRAMVALVGLGANTVDVAIYPKTHTDAAGAALTGEKTYTIHFETLPPTLEGGFWSVTAYNEENFLIDNPIDRYCVNDRSAYRLNEDGTLDITLSKEAPEDPPTGCPFSDGVIPSVHAHLSAGYERAGYMAGSRHSRSGITTHQEEEFQEKIAGSALPP